MELERQKNNFMKDKYLYLILGALIIGNVIVGYGNVKASKVRNEVLVREVRNVLPENEDKAGKIVMMRVSAYSSVEGCDDTDCIMANGRRAYVGAVACPRSWKLGTVVKIEDRKFVCGDRLSKKYDDRLDVFAGFGQEGFERSRQWGVKRLEVEIIN